MSWTLALPDCSARTFDIDDGPCDMQVCSAQIECLLERGAFFEASRHVTQTPVDRHPVGEPPWIHHYIPHAFRRRVDLDRAVHACHVSHPTRRASARSRSK